MTSTAAAAPARTLRALLSTTSTSTNANANTTATATASDAEQAQEPPPTLPLAQILPSQRAGKGNDRVVVLGSGWAGFQLALEIDPKIPLTIVSPNNHFLFTPLLPSTTVGTLEFRCIQEPVRKHLGPRGSYLQAIAQTLDPIRKTIICKSVDNKDVFELEYDKLVIAVGVKPNTFGIESISQAVEQGDQVFFLKQLAHARAIRGNIVDCLEKAALPHVSPQERKRLLSFVVVGGGPTSCEFVAELHDFIKKDVPRLYRDMLPNVSITLVEAGPALLGPFDKALQDYAQKLFRKRDIDVRLGTAVIGVEDCEMEGPDGVTFRFPAKRALLSDGTQLDFGTMVWSAGLAPQNFTTELDPSIPRHPRIKRILVDEYLRVKGHEGSIWAIGDAAVNDTGLPFPQLAQVARQQGIYLAKVMNGKRREDERPFKFFSLGSMAFMGEYKGIWDGSTAGPLRDPNSNPKETRVKAPAVTGFAALVMWRFAYWGRQVSVVNKFMIPLHWFKTFFFGRDVSRF